MNTIAKIIRIKGTKTYIQSAERVVDAAGNEIDEVSIKETSNPLEARQFNPDNNDAEMFVQSTPDSGFLTKSYSDPLQGGVARYEVVPLSIAIGDPVANWIE